MLYINFFPLTDISENEMILFVPRVQIPLSTIVNYILTV